MFCGDLMRRKFKKEMIYVYIWLNYFAVQWKLTHFQATVCASSSVESVSLQSHGIHQVRILGWIAISFSKGSSRPRDQTGVPALQVNSLLSNQPGKPKATILQ